MLNLHAIVRGPISGVHPEQVVQWRRSLGATEQTDGTVANEYASPVAVMAQVQALGPQDLRHEGNVGYDAIERKFWLFSSADGHMQPAGVQRCFARTGDLIDMADGTTWLVTAVEDDFHLSEWVCVRGTLQIGESDPCRSF